VARASKALEVAPHSTSTSENRLLGALPHGDRELILAAAEFMPLPFRTVLYQPYATITHAYFPTSGVVSMVNVMRDGGVEVGTVGNEGMVGVPILLHARSMPTRVLVQVGGAGWRIPAESLLRVVRDSEATSILFYKWVQALLDQVAQSVACNRLHALEQRCARWLLMTHDRAEANEFALTQEFLSYMLGVHRPAVTLAAGALSDAGLISYRRGRITVVDRPGLERASCDCYQVTRTSFHELFGSADGNGRRGDRG
jgi:CRP-like cAMP-binding protein